MEDRRIDRSRYDELLKYFLLRVTEQYEFPPQVIRLNGVVIGTMGNFSVSTGKPKSRKTFNVSAIVAAAVSGKEVLKYTVTLPPEKNRILYVDTEQSRYHCQKVLRRILAMAGLPEDRENDRILFFVLREYTPEQRRDIIECALSACGDIGLVIIDGARDLLRDINSPGEAFDTVNDFLRWSGYYGLHIHTVLHQNKSDDNTRGHIGTELNNKAETVLQVVRNVDRPEVSEVRPMHSRDQDSAPFAFSIGEDAIPFVVEEHEWTRERRSPKLPDPDSSDNLAILDDAFSEGPVQTYEELTRRLKSSYEKHGFRRGNNAVKDVIRRLRDMNLIFKTSEGYVRGGISEVQSGPGTYRK